MQSQSSILICPNDLVPQDTIEFTNAVREISGDLDSVIPKQEQISIFLHSRRATLQKVDIEHSKKKDELTKLSNEMEQCHARTNQLGQRLPFLKDSHPIVPGWNTLSELELKLYRIKEKNKNLTTILNSETHRHALHLCKEIIKKCESNPNISGNDLGLLISETEGKIKKQRKNIDHLPPKLFEAITIIHDEILRYLHYAAKNKPNLQSQINQLLQRLIPTQKPVDTLGATDEQKIAEINNYLNSLNVALKNERYFLKGIYFVSLRYRNISEIIASMHETAKHLQGLEFELENKIKTAWMGQDQRRGSGEEQIIFYRSCLKHLEGQLAAQKEKLYEIASDEVHSGLHYVASLFIWAGEIQHSVDFLDQIIQPSWQTVAIGQQLLHKSLTQVHPASLDAIKKLYNAIIGLQSIRKTNNEENPFLQEYKKKIISRITTSLVRIERSLFPLSKQEQELETAILQKHATTNLNHLKIELKTYIMKKSIHCLYFSNTRQDLSLNLFLTALKAREQDRVIFQEIIEDQGEKEFNLLLTGYQENTNLDKNHDFFILFNEISSFSKEIEKLKGNSKPQSPQSIFFIYCQYQQKILEARQLVADSPSSKTQVEDFLHSQKEIFSTIAKEYNFPNYWDDVSVIENSQEVSEDLNTDVNKLAYGLLLPAIWAKNLDQKNAAREKIDRLVPYPNPNPKFSRDTNILLKLLAFERLLSKQDTFSETEKTYLPYFFAQHIEYPTFWSQLFPMGKIESTLYNVLHRRDATKIVDDPVLQNMLAQYRNNDMAHWKSAISSYTKFVEFLSERKPIQKDTLEEQECQGYRDAFIQVYQQQFASKIYYSSIFNSMLKEMNDSMSKDIS